jgi:hypothetical protein
MLHTNTKNGLEDFQGGRAHAHAGFRLREHLVCSSNCCQLTRKSIAGVTRIASLAFSGEALLGDNHVFVAEAAS